MLPSEQPLNRKRATKSRPVDDNLDELLEMRSLGIKVALPKVKVRRVIMDPLQVHDSPSDTPHALSIASLNFVTPDHHLEHVMSNDLQDWLDLVELGVSSVDRVRRRFEGLPVLAVIVAGGQKPSRTRNYPQHSWDPLVAPRRLPGGPQLWLWIVSGSLNQASR